MTDLERHPPAWASGTLLTVVALEALFTTAAAPLLLHDTASHVSAGALFAAPAIAGAGGIAYAAQVTRAGRLALRLGAAVLSVGLAAMAVAPNWQSLVGGRLIAAFGGSMAVSSIYALVTADIDTRRRGELVGIIGVAISVPAVVVPLLSYVTSRTNQGFVFGALASLALIALSGIPGTLRTAATAAPRTRAVWTWAGASVAIAALWATTTLRSWIGVAALIIGVCAGALLLLTQIATGTEAPGSPRLVLCARALAMALFFGVDILLPFYVIDQLSLSAQVGAVTVVTSAIGWAISSTAFPALQRRGHVVAAAQAGGIGLVVAVALTAIITATVPAGATTVTLIAVAWLVAGAGTGALSCASTELTVAAQTSAAASTGPALQMIDAVSIAVGTGLAVFLIAHLPLPATIAVFALGTPACLAALSLHRWSSTSPLAPMPTDG